MCYLYVIPNVNMLLTQKSSKERGMEPKRANSLSLWEKQAPNLSIINCIRIVILRVSVGHDDDWIFGLRTKCCYYCLCDKLGGIYGYNPFSIGAQKKKKARKEGG